MNWPEFNGYSGNGVSLYTSFEAVVYCSFCELKLKKVPKLNYTQGIKEASILNSLFHL